MYNDVLTYNNFDIAIRKWNGEYYPTQVISSPAGETQGALSFATITPDVINNLRHLRDLVLSENSRPYSLHDKTKQAKEFGELLFDALMSDNIRSCFDVSLSLSLQGLRIRLRIDPPELAVLPWELMVDQRTDRFLSLSIRTPIVRYVELQKTSAPFWASYPLNILIVIAAPQDSTQLNSDNEATQMITALSKLEALNLARVSIVREANLLAIQKRLREDEFHIFHFIGHGHYSLDDGEGYLVFENLDRTSHLINGRKLGVLLHDEQSLRLVVLNACATGQITESDSFSGVASAIVQAGIPAVLAMQSQISDKAALQFSQVFYEALADGYPIDAAVAEGRRAIDFALEFTIEWAIPQLFMRGTDGVLFRFGSFLSQTIPTFKESLPEEKSEETIKPVAVTTASPRYVTVAKPDLVNSDFTTDGSMIHIPASSFIFGDGQRLYLPDYEIDTFPVTNRDYLRFVQATATKHPTTWSNGKFPSERADHPVTGISWHEAAAYARWVNKRLPTQAEWEKAARGCDGRRFPWGNEFDSRRCNTLEAGLQRTTSIASYVNDESPYGVRDLIGNVWEWTADEEKARGLGVSETKRIIKGGAWNSPGRTIDCSVQSRFWPDHKHDNVGFRCVRSKVN